MNSIFYIMRGVCITIYAPVRNIKVIQLFCMLKQKSVKLSVPSADAAIWCRMVSACVTLSVFLLAAGR